ncbi:MAG: DUF3261 domain-containing protein [Planctomycetes bacterium]|nr:DUF3261 domain-containing protein [Planctomycetota bacterium]
MRIRSVILAAVVALAAVPARSAESPSLPEHLLFHISASSLVELVDNLDAAAAAVTAKTPQAVPPGLVKMMVGMQLPFPMDGWDIDKPIHFLAEKGEAHNFMFLVTSDDIAELREALEAIGVEVEVADDHSFRADFGRGGLAVRDLGDGRIALAPDLEAMDSVLNGPGMAGWRPEHPADALLYFAGDFTAAIEESLNQPSVGLAIMAARARVLAAVTGGIVTPETAELLADAMTDGYQQVLAELSSLGTVRARVTLDNKEIHLRLAAAAQPGSLLADLAESWAPRPAVASSLAFTLPKGIPMVATSLPLRHMVPRVEDRFERFVAAVGSVYPDQREALAKTLADLVNLQTEEGTVTICQITDNCMYNVYYIPTSDADAYAQAILTLASTLNDILLASFKPGTAPVDSFLETRSFEHSYGTVTQIASPLAALLEDHFARALRQAGLNDDASFLVPAIYVGFRDGVAVLLVGNGAGDDDMRDALDLLGLAGNSMLATDGARQALTSFYNVQAAAAIVDPTAVLRMVALQQGRTDRLLGGADGTDILDAIWSRVRRTDSFLGYSMGADTDGVTLELYVPTDAAICRVEHFQIYRNELESRQAASRRQATPSAEANETGEEAAAGEESAGEE